MAVRDNEKLAADTCDTVHLATLDNDEAIYLDKLAGQRAVEISSRIGGRKAVGSTGVGKAHARQERGAWCRWCAARPTRSGASSAHAKRTTKKSSLAPVSAGVPHGCLPRARLRFFQPA